MTTERIFAIEACREVLETFIDNDFSVSKKGLKVSRTIDKDIKQEIEFQVTTHHDIIIHYIISSKKIKNWFKEKYSFKREGIITAGQLGYLTPRNDWHTWQIGTSDIAKNQFTAEAKSMIQDYLIPLFERFYDIDRLINDLCQYGGKWSQYTTHFRAAPLCFTLIYGGSEKAQLLFDNYLVETKNCKQNIIKHKLHEIQYNPNIYVSPFVGSEEIVIAFDNGIKMNL